MELVLASLARELRQRVITRVEDTVTDGTALDTFEVTVETLFPEQNL